MKMVRRICMLTSELKGLLHQILPTSTIRNVWRRERRTCMLISEFIKHWTYYEEGQRRALRYSIGLESRGKEKTRSTQNKMKEDD